MLSDITGDQRLDPHEFAIAMYLINCRLKKIDLPDTLPASLLSPSTATSSGNVPPTLVSTPSTPNLSTGNHLLYPFRLYIISIYL